MAAEPFVINSYFMDFIFPFVLVFVLIFAILEKSKLLGDESRKMNAIIGAVVGLILIATPYARDLVNSLMPFLAVVAVILLVFMLLWGFISGNKDGDVLNKELKITFGVILGIALVGFLLWVTGYGNVLWELIFNGSDSSRILVNGLIIVIVIAGLAAVLWGGKEK